MTDLDEVHLDLPPGPVVALDLAALERRVVRRRARRRLLSSAIAVLLVAVGTVAVATRAGDRLETGPLGEGEAPSPLFDAVEQLTPTSLPEGWARCGGGASPRRDAGDDWWAQTFGPVVEGECTPSITVTQVPPDATVDMDPDLVYDEVKIGEGDAMRWDDPNRGAVTLFTWAIDQNLVIESCCSPDAEEHLFDVALAAMEGTRQRQPARCTKPGSDLDRESLTENAFGKRTRFYDEEECPIRTDIARLTDNGPDAHCSAGVSFLEIGTPFGASMDSSELRLYTREPDGHGDGPNPLLDLEATLPPSAVDTGYSKDGRTLWIDPADESRVYLVTDVGVEAWPIDMKQHMCA